MLPYLKKALSSGFSCILLRPFRSVEIGPQLVVQSMWEYASQLQKKHVGIIAHRTGATLTLQLLRNKRNLLQF